MEIQKATIGRILSNSSQKLQVPKYQRDFVWDDYNADEFFRDLTVAVKEKDKSYFLGTFIFSRNSDESLLDIVDGQQRITSIFILLIACRVFAFHRKNKARKSEVKAKWKKSLMVFRL